MTIGHPTCIELDVSARRQLALSRRRAVELSLIRFRDGMYRALRFQGGLQVFWACQDRTASK